MCGSIYCLLNRVDRMRLEAGVLNCVLLRDSVLFPTCHDPSCEVRHLVTVYVTMFSAHSPIYDLRVFNQCLFASWNDLLGFSTCFLFSDDAMFCLWESSCLALSIIAFLNCDSGCQVLNTHFKYSVGTSCINLPRCLPNFNLLLSISR